MAFWFKTSMSFKKNSLLIGLYYNIVIKFQMKRQ